jgi:PilZ domain
MPQLFPVLDEERYAWSASEDRRASPRRPAKIRVSCRLLTSDAAAPSWTAQVRELSAFGIGLMLSKPPGHGQLLAIELARTNGTVVRNVLARVVHEVRESSQSYIVGCAFIKELADEHLRFFHAGAVHPSAPDCRRWARFASNVETVCYTCDTAPGERRSARILDISAGGIGLALRCQFAESTLLHFELPQEMNLADPNLLVRVVRVKDQGDGTWILGCEFADQLSEDEVQRLVR